MKITDKEHAVIHGIIHSEYNSSAPDDSDDVWSWSVAYNCKPAVVKTSVPGVIASLVKKGLAVCSQNEVRKDDCVRLTDRGVGAYKARAALDIQ
jgi:hypothetical protein